LRCPWCSHENREGAIFCGECGRQLEQVCTGCGVGNPPTNKFCHQCGQPFTAAAAAPAHFALPHSYTPRHLAEKILTSRSALEGERKQVTVLFVDVSGFTSLAERLDPEDVHRFMTRAFELMLAEVHRYEGTVNQFLGDGIMALFGAPIAHEDHARRAVLAALGIRTALTGYQDELKRQGDVSLQVREGLNTGLVVVGKIGDNLRMDYTAIGDTTNVAARLVQDAGPGRVVISEATHRLVEGYVHTRPLGSLSLRGRTAPIRAWEVISPRRPRTRLEVEAERGLTRFVGRERELRLLFECFEKVQAGHGQMVFIVGEAGLGKSRLLLEFRERLGTQVTWLEGHAMPFSQSIAFYPLIDILKRHLRIEEEDKAERIAERIDQGVLRLGEDLRPILPYLRFLLSVDPGDPAVLSMDPQKRRGEIFSALRRLTLRAAEIRPQVVVFEDIFLMDQATVDYLHFVMDSIPTGRVLGIFTYRTGYTHPFGERTFHTRIALESLAPQDTIRMAQAMLGTEALSEELRALVVRKAEGNPLFVEEVIKSLRERGEIRRVADRYVLDRHLREISVPDVIQDLLMARIDRLEGPPKTTLQFAAVIGREFSRQLLDRIANLGDVTEEVLRRLKALELIQEQRVFPELTYSFKHALTHEVAYNSLLVQRRRELHRHIGAAIEELNKDRLAEQYEVLAYHFSKGDDPVKALEYLLKAGDKASKAFANHEAATFLEQALGLLGAEDLARRAEVSKTLASIRSYLGDAEASLSRAQSALELYTRLGDKRNVVAMHLHIMTLYNWRWDGAREDKALGHLEAAAALVEEDPDNVEKGLIYQRTGHQYLHRGRPATAQTWAQRAVDLFARVGVPMGTSLGTASTYTGRIDEGLTYNEANADAVLKTANPLIIGVWGHELLLSLALVRDVQRARQWGERILPEIGTDNPVFEAMLRRPLALIYTLAGHVREAQEACEAVESIESKTLLGCIFEDASCVGFHYLRRGEWDKAREHMERAIPLFQARNNFAALGACSLILGHLHLELQDYARAEELLLQSLDICREGGNVLLELWVLPSLCELYLGLAERGKAGSYVERGFELLRPDQNWYGLAALAHLAKGMLASAERDWETAVSGFETAAAINRRHQLPYDEARACHELGLMYLARGRAGDRRRADEQLDKALDIFQRVGATTAVEKVRATRG
jgi:class 3 adenylate cyclase/tetratricopeptide (TPR) repeat protein